MAAEKNFENKVKRWLQSEGIYPLGTGADKMNIPPRGYYEKRWGGGYTKAGLPDMHIVIDSISVDVELKASGGKASDIQKHNIKQINQSGAIAFILYPEGFNQFKEFIKGVKKCNIPIHELTLLKNANSSTKCDTLTE